MKNTSLSLLVFAVSLGSGVAFAQQKAPARATATETWTDPKTGLTWATKDNTGDNTQQQAAAYCKSLDLAGFRDWRLPKLNEAVGLYDPSTVSGNRHLSTGIFAPVLVTTARAVSRE